MEKCDGCSCELNKKTKFNINKLQKVLICKRTKVGIVNLTEFIFYSSLLSFIYYKYEKNSHHWLKINN